MKKIWETILFFFYFIALILLFSLVAFKKKGRATHKYGVGGAGTLKVVDRPEFPEHEFWQAGRVFPIQLRHATVSYEDDAAMDARSVSFRLSDSEEESPLDILMNTGPRSSQNIIKFWEFSAAGARNKRDDEPISSQGMEEYCQNPTNKKDFIETLRRAPDSFAQIYYASKFVNYFKAKDGKLRYVKYRVIPEDRGIDSGTISGEDLEKPWLQKRRSDETRPIDYLRQEYLERLSQKPIIYHLQLRLHDDMEGDKGEIFTQEYEWSEETSPWLDLATIAIERPLSFEETEKMSLNVGRQPDSLGAVQVFEAHDPNSLNAARIRIYELTRWVRNLTYQQSGIFKKT